MFRGSSFHTIDAKGRIIIPARFRENLGEQGGDGVMVTKLEGHLKAYPYDVWEELEKRILEMPRKTEEMRRFRRIFIGAAVDGACDKQGRILVPPPLREYGGLEKEIVLVGVIDHFEIWNRDKWTVEDQQYEADTRDEGFQQEIAELGL